ncbi:MAG TPA: hypothetical protein VN372_00915 [Methanospirillum sp.]|nr:hypothetical protein [Methanospirillum sp.]
MTEALACSPQFTEKQRQALRIASGRSLSEVKDSGAYLNKLEPNKDGNLYQEYWDITVFHLSRKRKKEDVISLLQARNKKLDPEQVLPLETMRDIIDQAYSFIKTSQAFEPPELKEGEPARRIPYFEKDGKLYLTCISRADRYSYAHLEAGRVVFSPHERDPMGMITVPPELPVHQDRGTTTYIIGLPRNDLLEKAILLSPDQIYTRIRDHFYTYFDAPEVEYELFVYYALYSWYFSKCSTTPYLRFLGDTGKGKSRFLKVISDLCFYPIRASGSSSLSGLMRQKERWMGTLLIDESDLKGDQSDPLIKYLNLGFEKDNHFLLTDKNDVSKCHIFDPYGPKVIAMRQPFRDSATEGRCLSFSPDETTREDIPPELPSRYVEEVAELRALITRFTFEHWNAVSEDCMISCNGMGLEGRLKQMARPLSIILRLFPNGEERFRKYLDVRQKEIKQTRAESWEGGMFNYAYELATMQEDLMSHPDFGMYYYGAEIHAVLPKMIADALKVSPKAVTRALEGIGMEVRPKRVTITTKGEKSSKKVRPLLVPSKKKWDEIIQRYYFNEDGGPLPECPDCLRGVEYNTIQTDLSGRESPPGCVPSTHGRSGTREAEKDHSRPETDHRETVVPHVPDEHPHPEGSEIAEPDQRGTDVPLVPDVLGTHTALEHFREWLNHHQIPDDITPDRYKIMPESQRAEVFCKCKGCSNSGRDTEMYFIPSRLYQQICVNCFREFQGLYEKGEQ